MIAPRSVRRRRRSPLRLVVGAVVAAAAVFAAGIALGMALQDNPQPNLTVTSTKTLIP
ncbi:MAG TPA: hypothetical protein VFI10_06330 [Gaiellaceae bacterium]|nr:hypothetical protein [Gaiellaceae bacterium]